MYSLVLMMAMTGAAGTPASHGGCHACACFGSGPGLVYANSPCSPCAPCGPAVGGSPHQAMPAGPAMPVIPSMPPAATRGEPPVMPLIPGGTTRAAGSGTGVREMAPAPRDPDRPATPPRKKERDGGTTAVPPGEPRAAVLVRLPADARLYANQVLTAPGSAERQFVTPELEPGRDYHYVLRTEVSRDGRTVSEARRVVVRAGERLRVEFDDPGEPLDADRARVTVKLPADAKLYVDGKPTELASESRAWESTRLDDDREYYYDVTVEVTRDGQKQTQTKRVLVRAGQKVRVDFGDLTGPTAAAK
jgi:uncharacterized protein (TIGR03000 family)